MSKDLSDGSVVNSTGEFSQFHESNDWCFAHASYLTYFFIQSVNVKSGSGEPLSELPDPKQDCCGDRSVMHKCQQPRRGEQGHQMVKV